MSLKRIALVVDRIGWAWHSMALGLQKYSPSWCECDVYTQDKMDDVAAEEYDAVLWFSWSSANTRIRQRLVSVVASHSIEHTPWKSTLEKRHPDESDETWAACVASRLANHWTTIKRLPAFSGLIAVTPSLLQATARIADIKQATYLPAGIDPELWPCAPPRLTGGRLRVGWCGQYDERKPDPKGVRWILRPLMERVGQEVEWVVNMRDAEHALTQVQMRQWYRDIDVLLVTSICEGTPMPLLEAMCSGRPVLATSVGDAPQMVDTGKTGVLLDGYDDQQSAESVIGLAGYWIRRLSQERRFAAQMGVAASSLVRERRSWEDLAPAWLSFVSGPKVC